MKDLLIQIFGEYVPVTTPQVVEETVEGVVSYDTIDVVASGMAGVDWVYICGVLLFGVVLYSLFRIIGVMFK